MSRASETAATEMSDSVKAALREAVNHHQAGDLTAARQHYDRILAEHPELPDALHLRGVVALQSGAPQEAADLIGRAAARRPDDSVFLSNLGEAQRALGQLDAAIASYGRALEVDPHYADAHCNLGSALRMKGQDERALASYRRALEIQPDFPSP